jgi:WD40 repeat protein
MCSGDEKGLLKVWAFDHPEHLTKYETQSLTGAIRDVDWDGESKRLAIGGERLDARTQCAVAIQWDGVSAGLLAQFQKGRVSSVAFKPSRPFRIVTAGMDEPKCYFHQGPPFQKIPSQNGIPCEDKHSRGGVQCVRYNSDGSLVVSVGTDRSIALYDGNTFEAVTSLEAVHTATIFSAAWSADDKHIMTASGDGTCKLFGIEGSTIKELHTWEVAKAQASHSFEKVPVGGTQLGCTFVQNSNTPVSVGFNGQLSLLPMPGSGSEIEVITGHYAPISGLAVNEEHGVFFTGDTNGILCKWDLNTTKCLQRLDPPEGNPDLMNIVHGTTAKPAAISGITVTSSHLYSVGWDDTMLVSDVYGTINKDGVLLGAQPICIVSGSELAVIVTVKGLILVNDGNTSAMVSVPYEATSAAVSKDDTTVFVGGADAKIHIYSTDGVTLTETQVIEGKHLKPVYSLALSPDGNLLASGDEKDIVVTELDDLSSVVGRGKWCFHVQKVVQLCWAPDCKTLVSGGADDSIYVWNIDKKMSRLHYRFAHRGGLTGLFVFQKAAGIHILSVGADSVVNRWDVTKDVNQKFAS